MSLHESKPWEPLRVMGFWLLVGLPLGWGVYNTLVQAMKLFNL